MEYQRTLESTDLVQTARHLATVVAEGAQAADCERRLPEQVARAMAAAGLFRTSVARAWGGFEADPLTTIRVIESIAEADGAAGWNLMIGIETSGVASGAVEPEAGEEVFLRDPSVIIAGAGNPLGRARPVAGGWIVNGRWPFASGCHNAGWFWAGHVLTDSFGNALEDATGRPVVRQMLVPRADWEILDTWQVAGLRGSGSHDVEVRDAFVPTHRVTDAYADARIDSPLFRYPLLAKLCYNKVGVATGIARAAIDAFVQLAGVKTPFLARSLLRDRPQAQLAVAEADAALRAGRAFLFDAVGEMWSALCSGETPSKEQRIRQRLAASFAVDSAVRAVELVHAAAGATANFQASPLERRFRDVHVVRQHITVSPAFYENAGRALLGLEVDAASY